MIYARKVLEKDGCIIYLAADIKCLDYHTPCSLTAEISGKEYTLSSGDVLLFRNALKPYVRSRGQAEAGRVLIFSSEDCATYIYGSEGDIYMRISAKENTICEFKITYDELTRFYKLIDLSWYNRTLPVYR